MCIKTPLSEEEMLNVNGVGQNKYDKYGERFLREINSFTGGRKEKLYFGDREGKPDCLLWQSLLVEHFVE